MSRGSVVNMLLEEPIKDQVVEINHRAIVLQINIATWKQVKAIADQAERGENISSEDVAAFLDAAYPARTP